MARGFSRQAAGRLAALVIAAALAAGCGQQPSFKLTNVTGAKFGRELALTDHDGRARTLADFRGKVLAVTFGFTNCPDVCPTTLADLAALMKELGPDAQRVQVLFVTLDPERDRALLKNYVPAFNAHFLGLYGDAAATARTAQEFKVFYQKQPPARGGGYALDHSAGIYLFDREGRLRVFAPYGHERAALLHDVKLLLSGSEG
jgi:protein SCO1/2